MLTSCVRSTLKSPSLGTITHLRIGDCGLRRCWYVCCKMFCNRHDNSLFLLLTSWEQFMSNFELLFCKLISICQLKECLIKIDKLIKYVIVKGSFFSPEWCQTSFYSHDYSQHQYLGVAWARDSLMVVMVHQ